MTCETYLSEVLRLRSPSFTKKSGHSIRSECEVVGTAGRLGLNDNDLLIWPWVIFTSVNASRLIVSTTIWAIWQILVIWVWDKINLHFSYGLRLLIFPYLVFLRQTSLILRFGTLIRAKYIHWRSWLCIKFFFPLFLSNYFKECITLVTGCEWAEFVCQ